MKPPDNTRRAGQRGQAVVMFGFLMIVLIGAMGLVADLGWAYYLRESMRAAAESAALAASYSANTTSSGAFSCGSSGVVCQSATQCPTTLNSSSTSAFQVACNYANDNGFAVTTGGTQNVMVAAGTGAPPTVSGLTVPYWVTVTVAQTVPQTFAAVFGHRSMTVSVRATAAFNSSSLSCIYILNPSSQKALSMSGSTTLQTGCNLIVNSSSSDAVDLSGGAKITTTQGAKTKIDGNWKSSGGATISPAPVLGTTTPDPFASISPPSIGSCLNSGLTVGGGTVTLYPGVYCGALQLNGGTIASMQPGTYILEQGISLSSSSSISGSGVMLYVPGGQIQVSGSGSINLSGPTSGSYQGIVIYQPASNTSAVVFSGSSALNISGVAYMPGAQLQLSGGTGSTSGTTLVANTILLSGNTTITRGAASAFTPSGSGAALVE